MLGRALWCTATLVGPRHCVGMGKHHLEKTVDITTGTTVNHSFKYTAVAAVTRVVNSFAQLALSISVRRKRKKGLEVPKAYKRIGIGLILVDVAAVAGLTVLRIKHAERVKDDIHDALHKAGLPATQVLKDAPPTLHTGPVDITASAGWISRNHACAKTGMMVDVHVIITRMDDRQEHAIEIITTPAIQ